MTSPASTTTTSPRCSSDAGARRCRPAAAPSVSERIARSASACALAAALGQRLGEVGEDDGQPQPDRDGEREPARARRRRRAARRRRAGSATAIVVISAPTSTTNITGLRTCTRGSSLRSDADERRPQELAAEQGGGRLRRSSGGASWSRARLSLVTLTPGSPRTPRKRPSVLSAMSSSTRASGRWRTAATRCAWMRGVGLRDVRVDAGAGGRHRVDGDLGVGQARVVAAARARGRRRAGRGRRTRADGWFGPAVGEEGAGRRCSPVCDGRGWKYAGRAGDGLPSASFLPVSRRRPADQARADDLAVDLDLRAVGLAGERDLRDPGHDQRVGEAEQHREDERRRGRR